MKKSKYQYRLITTREGQIPITEVKEGMEVLSMGKWVRAPSPVKGKALRCEFESLPTTTFEKECASFKREASICHKIILCKTEKPKPELSVRGYFSEDKKNFTLIKGLDTLTYWLPRFIKLYDEPLLPGITQIGFNLYHHAITFTELKGDELSERNLEYILEGMLRRTFFYSFGKYKTYPITSWNETHRITMRLLDIECEYTKGGDTVIKNPVSMYQHVRDEYNKGRIKDEDIVFNLKRANRMPLYTNGHRILKKTEVEDWILPGINPDINTINPMNSYESGFTKMNQIYREGVERFYNSAWKREIVRERKETYLKDNLYVMAKKDP